MWYYLIKLWETNASHSYFFSKVRNNGLKCIIPSATKSNLSFATAVVCISIVVCFSWILKRVEHFIWFIKYSIIKSYYGHTHSNKSLLISAIPFFSHSSPPSTYLSVSLSRAVSRAFTGFFKHVTPPLLLSICLSLPLSPTRSSTHTYSLPSWSLLLSDKTKYDGLLLW